MKVSEGYKLPKLPQMDKQTNLIAVNGSEALATHIPSSTLPFDEILVGFEGGCDDIKFFLMPEFIISRFTEDMFLEWIGLAPIYVSAGETMAVRKWLKNNRLDFYEKYRILI